MDSVIRYYVYDKLYLLLFHCAYLIYLCILHTLLLPLERSTLMVKVKVFSILILSKAKIKNAILYINSHDFQCFIGLPIAILNTKKKKTKIFGNREEDRFRNLQNQQ